jgi:hypothetical protein
MPQNILFHISRCFDHSRHSGCDSFNIIWVNDYTIGACYLGDSPPVGGDDARAARNRFCYR